MGFCSEKTLLLIFLCIEVINVHEQRDPEQSYLMPWLLASPPQDDEVPKIESRPFFMNGVFYMKKRV